MNAGYASPPRPEPVSWKRRFMRFGWLGSALRPERAPSDRGESAGDHGMFMATEHRFSHGIPPDALASERPQGDPKPRLSLSTCRQLGSRLKAIYSCDQTPAPDAFRNLVTRIESCLQSRK